jgi:acetolactate decarboxylase
MRALALCTLLGVASCSSSGWDGSVQSWGGMREVMRGGRTQARISLSAAARSSRTLAIGALEGLGGEVVMVRGEIWVADTSGGRLACGLAGVDDERRATLLVSADVPRWREIELREAVRDLDQLLGRVAQEHGLAGLRAWPFVVEGTTSRLDAHVLRGGCPFAGEVEPGREPIRRSFEDARARLVGFHAPGAAGELTHHGTSSHVHVVIAGSQPFVGHVDRVELAPGAVLSVPVLRGG